MGTVSKRAYLAYISSFFQARQEMRTLRLGMGPWRGDSLVRRRDSSSIMPREGKVAEYALAQVDRIVGNTAAPVTVLLLSTFT